MSEYNECNECNECNEYNEMTAYEYYLKQEKERDKAAQAACEYRIKQVEERDKAQHTLEIVTHRLSEYIMEKDSNIALYESFDDDQVEEFYKEIAASARSYTAAYRALMEILEEREEEAKAKQYLRF